MAGPAQVPGRVLAWLHDSLAREYLNVDRTYSEVARTLSYHPSLSPRTDVYSEQAYTRAPNTKHADKNSASEAGASTLLLLLEGTLPVQFRGAPYRFPIAIWIPQAYPRQPPLIFVTPGRDLAVRPGQHVSVEGRVYHPYLAQWTEHWDKSSLVDCLAVLQDVFTKEPPVVARQQQGQSLSQLHMNGGTRPLIVPPGPSRQLPLSPRSGSQASQGPQPPPHPPKPSEVAGSPPVTSSYPPRGDSIGSSAGPPLPPKPNQTPQSPSSASSYSSPLRNSLPGDHNHISKSHQQEGRPLAPLPKPPAYKEYHPLNPNVSRHQGPRPIWPPQQPHPYPTQTNPQQMQNFQAQPYSRKVANQQFQNPMQYSYQPQPQQARAPQSYAQPTRPPLDLLSLPLDLELASQSSNVHSHAPPIPPNPEKDALLQALSTTLRSQLQQAIGQNHAAIPALQAQQSALQQAQQNMQAELYNLEQLNTMLDANEKILRESMREADRVMENVKRREAPSVDEVLVAPTVVGEQLYKLVADERSTADAMFALTRALDKGRISAEVFLKQTRSLAREQFLQKALTKKIGRGMGLVMEDGR